MAFYTRFRLYTMYVCERDKGSKILTNNVGVAQFLKNLKMNPKEFSDLIRFDTI